MQNIKVLESAEGAELNPQRLAIDGDWVKETEGEGELAKISIYQYFAPVVIEPELKAIRDITKGAFYSRFNHQTAIELETTEDVNIKVFAKILSYRNHVNLDFRETTEGLDYMVWSEEFTKFDEAEKAKVLADGSEDERF